MTAIERVFSKEIEAAVRAWQTKVVQRMLLDGRDVETIRKHLPEWTVEEIVAIGAAAEVDSLSNRRTPD